MNNENTARHTVGMAGPLIGARRPCGICAPSVGPFSVGPAPVGRQLMSRGAIRFHNPGRKEILWPIR